MRLEPFEGATFPGSVAAVFVRGERIQGSVSAD